MYGEPGERRPGPGPTGAGSGSIARWWDPGRGRGCSSHAVIPDEGLRAIRDACDVDLWEDELPPPRDVLLRRVAGVDGVLTLLTDRVDDELLDAAGPGLRVVSNFAVGYDNIDVAACTRRGIPVGNTPGRPDRDDRGPRLGAADGRRPAASWRATATCATAAGGRGAR